MHNTNKEYHAALESMLKKWGASTLKTSEAATEEKISSDDLPPYFMTLSEAVQLLTSIGFAPQSKYGDHITDVTIEHWEAVLEKHSHE